MGPVARVVRVALWRCSCGVRVPARGPLFGYVSADAALVGWVAHWRDGHGRAAGVSGVVEYAPGAAPVTLTPGEALALLVPSFEHL